jgi:two-component system chemotaxis response regulator CheY
VKILIADDSRVMRQIVIRTLRQAGFRDLELVEAADGRQGYETAVSEQPDLIISDWNMPEMSGLEFLRTLRGAGSTIPFGFVTTEGTPEMRNTAEAAGAIFLITKPFTAETFRDVLEPILT